MLTAVDAPVRISVLGCEPDEARGRWHVRWQVANVCNGPVVLEDAWVPHGRFRGDGHVLLDAAISPGGWHVLELGVSASEPPGTVVDNAFLILRLRGQRETWRVFARMRIQFSAASVLPVIEAVTVQAV